MALYKPTATGNQAFTDGTFFTDSTGFAEPALLQIQRLRFQNAEIKKLYLGGTRVFGVLSPTHVSTSAASSAEQDTSSFSAAFNVPSGLPNGFLVAWVFLDANPPPEATSATWRGIAMTKATGINSAQSNHRIQCFYKQLPASGAGNVVVNYPLISRVSWAVSLFRNIASIAQQYSTSSTATATFGFNGTRTAGNLVLAAAMHADSSTTLTSLGAGTRLHGVKYGAHQAMSGYLTSTAAGAFAANWTADTDVGQWVAAGLQLNHD